MQIPVLLELVERVDLLSPEVRRKLRRVIPDLLVDTVAKAMCGVGADHQRLVAEARAFDRGCRRHSGLADAALACVEDHSHARVFVLTDLMRVTTTAAMRMSTIMSAAMIATRRRSRGT